MQVAIAFLPFVLMMLLWRRRITDWRDRLLIASVLWGGFAIVLTEGLSILNRIEPAMVFGGWVAGSVLVCSATKLLHFHWTGPEIPTPSPANEPPEKYAFVAMIVVLAAALAMVAWIGPPNNWDSMRYHMTRVMHWMQNRNVAFYPTGSLAQLELPPGAEYLILHLQILGRSDRWADMVQWFAYVGCIVGVSSVARLLGGGIRAQVFAATFAATLPIACLESGSTQNDLVSAFWFVCFIWSMLRICAVKSSSANGFSFAMCGLSLGLALLTKTTLYLLAAPFGFVLVVTQMRKPSLPILRNLLLLGAIALAMNAPTYARNYRFSRTFLGRGGLNTSDDLYENARFGIGVTTSNVLRNLGIEFAIKPPAVSHAVEIAIRNVHHWIGVDPDDPQTLFGSPRFEVSGADWNSEDHAANPVHVILILAAFSTLIIRNRNPWLWVYAGAILVGFGVFCTILRTQPWHCRLHLPMLVAFAALVGVIVERHWKPGLYFATFGLLPLLVTPWIFMNRLHPWDGPNSIFDRPRQAGYFAERDLQAKYEGIVDFAAANQAAQIAVIGDGACWEYPLQIMLRERLPHVRFEAYPSKYTWSADVLHTRNRGFDPSLKPYVVVQLTGETAAVTNLVK